MVLAAVGSPRARACTAQPAPDVRFFRLQAAVGEAWWIRGVALNADNTVTLTARDGSTIDATVASVGPQGSLAVLVPSTANVGDRFALPVDSAFEEQQQAPDNAPLEVVAPAGSPLDEVPTPDVAIDQRDVLTGYSGVLNLPAPCSRGPGLWNDEHARRPFITTDIPEGFVLDMTERPEGEAGFEPVTSANQVVFDAREPGTVDQMAQAPPGASDAFVVHARFRRMLDGATGEVTSVPVQVDDSSSTRLDCVGCSSTSAAPFGLVVAVLFLANRRRQRSAPPIKRPAVGSGGRGGDERHRL